MGRRNHGRLPRQRKQPRNANYSISDPAFAALVSLGAGNYSGVSVGEGSALALSAVYRAVSIVAGSVAGLPLRTVRDVDGIRTRTTSFLDDPGKPFGMTPFSWKETVLAHLLLHGNAYLMHIFNGAGSVVGLLPIHPLCVTAEWAPPDRPVYGEKLYRATLLDGTIREFDASTMTQIMAMSLDGLKGLSSISIARNSLGTAIAGDRAAAKLFSDGALLSGLVTAEDDNVDEEDAKVIQASLDRNIAGWENAAKVAFVNRKLKFTPWTMSMEDAQFLQSRQFQIEEISRWFGVPPHLLSQTEKQTSWGTGVAEQNRGLARYTLSPWTERIEEKLSQLLPSPRFCEFDYAGFIKPTPEVEIPLLIAQVNAGLMTPNEARRIRGMDPIPGGDELRVSQAPAPAPALEAVPV